MEAGLKRYDVLWLDRKRLSHSGEATVSQQCHERMEAIFAAMNLPMVDGAMIAASFELLEWLRLADSRQR